MPESHAFRGTSRFEVQRCLGTGGMGAVYRVRDHERDETVALKTLLWASPTSIYRLKKEFRTLADISHPNLVALYELIADGDQWFYTMELVEGGDFLQVVRPDAVDVPRLRACLRGLAEGIQAIHRAGKLHRDLKPSNVLVTPEGRVVILDFGIASDIRDTDDDLRTVEEGVMGTAAYLAPEQVYGEAVAASDWYALGSMLFEALTGELPFSGPAFSVVARKTVENAPSLDRVRKYLPEDLVDLAQGLLARDQGDRPSPEEILARLGAESDSVKISWLGARRDRPAELVGRHQHLRALAEAAEMTASGRPVLVLVDGPSGIGKSTLVEAFAREQSRTQSALILTGKCYERESVPFKGVEGVVDSLGRHLRMLPSDRVEALLTADVPFLSAMFPTLDRVEAIQAAPPPGRRILDPREVRRRAILALRQILQRLATGRPLIVYIDDLQWTDVDSMGLLEDLLLPLDPPGFLVILAFRTEEVESKPGLRKLVRGSVNPWRRKLHVGPLTAGESRGLVAHLRGAGGEAITASQVDSVVRESAGIPFLLEHLVRHLVSTSAVQSPGGTLVSLSEMLDTQLHMIPPEAHRLLDVLAVAAHPVDVRVGWRAAGGTGDERALITELRSERWLRFSGSVNQVEFYHDRIREAMRARVPADHARVLHRRLAEAMSDYGVDDPDSLLQHWLGAGDRAQAAGYAVRAADRAAAALAFERAAHLYRQAMDLDKGGGRSDLQVKLAVALANAGHGAEAARAYLHAAAVQPVSEAQTLRRLAAEQLLRCGHIDRGLEVIQSVLRAVGLRLARNPRHALLRLLLRRTWLRLTGLRFRPRPGPHRELDVQRIDTCWAVAIGLARVDNIRAADFQALHLQLTLKLGDAYRFVRALAAEAAFVSTAGQKSRARAAALTEQAKHWAERIQHPHALALARFADAVAAFYLGEFQRALASCIASERVLREECAGVAWEINTAQNYTLASLYYLGEWRELSRRVPQRLKEADDHGDLYAAADVAAGRPVVAWLFADDPDEARARYHDAVGRWTLQGFHYQHYASVFAAGQLELYSGDAFAAWSRIRARLPEIRRAMLLRIQQIRIEITDLHARTALAALVDHVGDRAQLEREIERDIRAILRERIPWARGLAHLLRAGLATVGGDREEARVATLDAWHEHTAADLTGHAMVARRRYAELVGGDEGAEILATVDRWMSSQGVVDADRLSRMLAPASPADLPSDR